MSRHTKIVATLGPASSDIATLERLVQSGVDVVRLNFSHGTAADHIQRAAQIREAALLASRPVGILADMQGPKIRVGKFENGKITLQKDTAFILDAKCELGNAQRAGLDYKDLPRDVKNGDVLLLDDGRLKLSVERILGHEIFCRVMVGGELSNNKGINRQGGGLTAPALTAKDMDDIKTAAQIGVDFVAISFPKSSADMYMARQLLRAAGSSAILIAKIERTEAVANLEEILDASDGIMVARGDLAVEVGDAAVPALQKRMIRLARERNKLAITATQMMESMIHSPVPTRAEVSDVANAVLDGTDAVMLSAETASGKFPVEVVESMARICLEAEKSAEVTMDRDFLDRVFTRIDQSIAMAAMWTAYHLKVKAIASLTQTGSTALWMSRLNSGVPIYALTPEVSARNQMTLYREVYPLLMSQVHADRDVMLWEAEQILLEQGVVDYGDLIVLTIGEPIGSAGGTNTMKIVRVGETPRPGPV
ncbi:pyruvate kinase [Zoogloea sp.]|uniref:pyruvate kinase n=1 Tax=Zoogloea sp. TaxID=49181 RepID=UPI002607E3B2|nr:pyruvate kinase [Zoogloea sp.]